MKTLNNKTQKAKNLIDNYTRATTTTLYEIYNNASIYKWRAYNNIIQDMEKDNGERLRVFNANSMQYSAGYTFTKDGEKFLKYYTKDNLYLIKL